MNTQSAAHNSWLAKQIFNVTIARNGGRKMTTNYKTNAKYDHMLATWQMCRDAKTGQRAIHARTTTYLPKVYSDQSAESYTKYLRRALFMNATGRTVDGMVGFVFRKYPKIKLAPQIQEYETAITMDGVSLAGLAQKIVEDVITVGRAGIMVDFPANSDGRILTINQAAQEGFRPYVAYYKAEDIHNWEYDRRNNRYVLTRLWLHEPEVDNDTLAVETVYRELHMDDGYYGQRIWRAGSLVAEVTPLLNGQRITEIPFWFCQPMEATGNDVQPPPIEDLVYVNLSHYQNSASLENGAFVAGQPTPWVNGVADPSKFPQLNLGSETFLALPPEATTGFLQCGSEGFATIEKLMDRKQEQMAQLGARILASDKKAAETAESQSIKRGGENSVLQTLAASIDMSLTKALQFMAAWNGASDKEIEETYIELNKDYLPQGMDAQLLTALVAAWQQGAISYPTFFSNLQKGELVAESATAEDEQDLILNAAPRLGAVSGV